MSAPRYLLGHSPEELQRLHVQGEFFADITRDALVAAGLRAGSRVLDIGCGAGDVSFLAADLIKPSGAVVGTDRSREAVAAARARAQSGGVSNAPLVSSYLAECLRSVRPMAISLGVTECTSQRIDELETELAADAANADAVFVSPPIVAAWCRHPC